MFIKYKITFIVLLFSLAFVSVCESAETVVVGGYEFAPFVQRTPEGNYDGVTFDLIAALNKVQEKIHFIFVSTLAETRYKAFQAKRFDLIFFEDKMWGWQDLDIVTSQAFLKGGDAYIALKKEGRDQGFFADLSSKILIGIKGYHYGVANFNTDPELLEEQYNLILGNTSLSVIKMLEYGRGDIAIVSLSFILPYLKQHQRLSKKILISEKLDHQYEHAILIRKNHQVTPEKLNYWLSLLEEQGVLKEIWKKRGLGELHKWLN